MVWWDAPVFESLELADPDPWRRRLRESWLVADPGRRRALCESLAKDVDLGRQPVRLLTGLATRLESTEEAVRLLRNIQHHKPNDFAANVSLAEKLMECHPPRVEDALRFYTAAVALNPESSKLRTHLGIALRKLNRADEADVEFHRSLSLVPDKAAAHYGLGSALTTAGFLDQAIAELRAAARLAPRNAAIHNNLGITLHKQGRFPEAVSAYREAIRLEPRLALAHMNLGRSLYAQGNTKGAIEAFSDALQVQPNLDEAKEYLDHAASTPARPAAKAGAHVTGREVRAGLDVDFSGHNPLRPDIYLRGVTLGEVVEAVITRNLQRAESPGYFTDHGVACYRRGLWKFAIKQLERSVKSSSGGTPRDWLFLAMAHWQLGEKDKARTWYDRAVAWMDKNKPHDEELKRFRDEAAALLGLPQAAQEKNGKM